MKDRRTGADLSGGATQAGVVQAVEARAAGAARRAGLPELHARRSGLAGPARAASQDRARQAGAAVSGRRARAALRLAGQRDAAGAAIAVGRAALGVRRTGSAVDGAGRPRIHACPAIREAAVAHSAAIRAAAVRAAPLEDGGVLTDVGAGGARRAADQAVATRVRAAVDARRARRPRGEAASAGAGEGPAIGLYAGQEVAALVAKLAGLALRDAAGRWVLVGEARRAAQSAAPRAAGDPLAVGLAD